MYEDAFYKKENIVGYTGNININPTVYFKRGNTFGRITQDHPNRSNIGRNKVRTKTDYKIANTASGHAEEYYDGRVQHRSRSLFKSASWFEKFKLAKAIALFPNQKPKP
jgi:hypothetical protein